LFEGGTELTHLNLKNFALPLCSVSLNAKRLFVTVYVGLDETTEMDGREF
jgi:hypothetical protein